jgi:hypothetical protein
VTEAEASVLYKAQQVLVRNCLKQQGFSWSIPPEKPIPEAREFPYVIDDATWARAHGYGSDIEQKADEVRRSDPNQRYAESLSADRRQAAVEALTGKTAEGLSVALPSGGVIQRSDKGCQSEAERDLYGDLQSWYESQRITETLTTMRQQRVLGDARFTAGTKRWSECMKKAGHPYATPAEAHAEQVGAPKSRQSQQRETSIALTEVTCAQSSGLAATAKQLDREYEQALRTQYKATVARKLRMELAAVPKARAIVHESPA